MSLKTILILKFSIIFIQLVALIFLINDPSNRIASIIAISGAIPVLLLNFLEVGKK